MTVRNDLVSPTTSITSPSNGATVWGVVSVAATASDNVGVTKVDLYLDGTLVQALTAAPYVWTWDTTKATNSSHTLTTKAYDAAGNVGASTPVAVTVNNSPPTTSISSPVSGASLHATSPITVTATSNVGVAKVEVYVDGSLLSTLTAAPYNVSWDTTTVPNGAHTLSSKAYDAVGNVGTSASVIVTVDNTPPAVTITYPSSGVVLARTTQIFAMASDNVGVIKVEFYLDGTLVQTVATEPYVWSWDTTTATNGNHTLTTRAYDAAGNVGTSAPVAVTVDNLPPTVSITSPASGASVRATIPISITATDNLGVVKVELYADGNLLSTLTTSPYSTSWDTTTVPNGIHTLTSKAYDAMGNVGTSALAIVTVDNTAPTTAVTAPSGGAAVAGTTQVSATASDNVGVTKVEFYLDGALVQTAATDPYVWSWNTTTATNGSHTLATRAYDAAGNVGVSASVTVSVDNLPPTTSITSPSGGAYVRATIPISATASDNVGVVKVQLYLDGNLLSTLTTSPYNTSWDTTTVLDGSHTLTSKAYDAGGNVGTSAPIVVTVDNTTPTTAITSPAGGAVVARTTQVAATASDNMGVVKVELYLDGTLVQTAATAPYTWTWDTTTATNGSHTLTSKDYDAAGNVGTSAPVTVTVDNQPPTVSVASPSGGANVGATIPVSITATDNVGVVKVEVYVDGSLLSTLNASPYNTSWNTTTFPNGNHTLSAKAYDAMGNVGTSASVTVNVDNTAPTTAISSPTGGAIVGGTTQVAATASDNVGVVKVEFYLDGTLVQTDATAPYTWTWDTTTATNGSHTLTSKAYDAAGNVGTSAPVSVTVDNLAPTTAITSPAGSAVVGGTTTQVTATASDNTGVTKVELYVDGTLVQTDTTAPYAWTWNTTTVATGSHTLTTKAYDVVGNVGTSAPVAVTVDNQPPTTSITSPSAGAIVRATIPVSATASDNVAVVKVEIYVDGSLLSTLTTSPYNTSWNTTTVLDGSHTLTSKAYDAMGNVGTSASVTVTVDNTAPTTAITSPAGGAIVGGATQVSATASDNVGVVKVEFYLDGALVQTDATAPYAWTWDTTTVTSGSHTLTSRAYDVVGNVGTSAPVTVTVDNIAPTTAITSPAGGAVVGGTTTQVTATASDNTLVAKVELYVDGTLVQTDTTAPYAWTWNTTTVATGSHTLTTKAYDVMGNVGTSAPVTVTVDNQPPTVSVTSPSGGANVGATIPVSVTATDNVGVVKVEVYVDGGLLSTLTTSPYNTSWNTTNFPNGSHTLSAKAYDAMGNVGTSATVTVNVDNTAPTTGITSPAGGAIVGGTIQVAATATDNVGVVKVEFYLDGTLMATDAVAPYLWSWNTTTATNASHTLTTKAYDAAGNVGTSAPVTVTVDNLPPTASITSPSSGSVLRLIVPITVSATDNVGVVKVEVYVDGSLLSTVTTSPFNTSWDTTTVPNGSHTLLAKAYDAAGNVGLSPSVTVTVKNNTIHNVFIIMMENQNWSSIKGNPAAPYINNTLLPMAAHAEQYYNPPGNHPSLPNYLWLEAGTNFGISNDSDPSVNHQSTGLHLVNLLEAASLSWKSYQEGISGTDCPLTSITSTNYAPKHNPMVYFDDVTNTNSTTAARCIAHVRPYTELATDLANNTVPAYSFITPDQCDDMHNVCASTQIQQGDTWLSTEVPKILNSTTYKNGGLLMILWDESEGGDYPIGMIVLSPSAKVGYTSNTSYTHSSTLLTLQEIFHVTPLLGAAATATSDLSDMFNNFP